MHNNSNQKPQTSAWIISLHLSSVIYFIPFYLNLIYPLIIFLVFKDTDKKIKSHASQVLNFQLSYSIINTLLFALIVYIAYTAYQLIPDDVAASFLQMTSEQDMTSFMNSPLGSTLLNHLIAIIMCLVLLFIMGAYYYIISILNSIRAYAGNPTRYFLSFQFFDESQK